MFHAIGGAGYVSDLNKAEVLSFNDAQKWINYNDGNIPLLKSLVDALSIKRVDHQYLDSSEADKCDKSKGWVKQIPDVWNGNDIQFVSEGGKTFNYSEAKVVEFGSGGYYWPVSYIDTVARSILKDSDVNERKMITVPGIRKPRKKRMKSSRVRWNCPCCGKINWQYNPYDFDGCSDVLCNEYRY
jgi:hypothetical protein